MNNEFDRNDYHLRLMIERMQRDGRTERTIEKAIRGAAATKKSARRGRLWAAVRGASSPRRSSVR
jgi:hypothetical protein